MSTHNICFHREIRKISAFFRWKKHLSVAIWQSRLWSDCADVQADLAFTVCICPKTHFCMTLPIFIMVNEWCQVKKMFKQMRKKHSADKGGHPNNIFLIYSRKCILWVRLTHQSWKDTCNQLSDFQSCHCDWYLISYRLRFFHNVTYLSMPVSYVIRFWMYFVRQASTNSVDPEKTSHQSLHCLPLTQLF